SKAGWNRCAASRRTWTKCATAWSAASASSNTTTSSRATRSSASSASRWQERCKRSSSERSAAKAASSPAHRPATHRSHPHDSHASPLLPSHRPHQRGTPPRTGRAGTRAGARSRVAASQRVGRGSDARPGRGHRVGDGAAAGAFGRRGQGIEGSREGSAARTGAFDAQHAARAGAAFQVRRLRRPWRADRCVVAQRSRAGRFRAGRFLVMNLRPPIAARHKGFNRAEIVDRNFIEFVGEWDGEARRAPRDDEPVLPGSALDARGFRELFESQLISRHLDLMARVLRVQNKVFYTIGSGGHEGNAMVARLTRHTDPAFLHYRSGGFMAERVRKIPGMDPGMDSALSFAASKDAPASGGRNQVWGSKPLWVLPQTSTIASHLPKALGTAVAIEQARRIGHQLPIPDDSI